MKETIICVSTPSARMYYKAVPLAKEFLDKEQNIVNTTGELPDGEITEFNVSSATVKHLLAGKLNGKFEVINLADNTVTYSEEYENGRLVSITERNLQKPAADKPKDEKPHSSIPAPCSKAPKTPILSISTVRKWPKKRSPPTAPRWKFWAPSRTGK